MYFNYSMVPEIKKAKVGRVTVLINDLGVDTTQICVSMRFKFSDVYLLKGFLCFLENGNYRCLNPF